MTLGSFSHGQAQWCLFIIISRASKWGRLKSAGNPRCAVHAEIHSICTDRPQPGPATGMQVSPTSDTCQSVAILMNRRHYQWTTAKTHSGDDDDEEGCASVLNATFLTFLSKELRCVGKAGWFLRSTDNVLINVMSLRPSGVPGRKRERDRERVRERGGGGGVVRERERVSAKMKKKKKRNLSHPNAELSCTITRSDFFSVTPSFMNVDRVRSSDFSLHSHIRLERSIDGPSALSLDLFRTFGISDKLLAFTIPGNNNRRNCFSQINQTHKRTCAFNTLPATRVEQEYK